MSKPPTATQKRRFERVASLGCVICGGIAEVHHCNTGAGGRKDHDKVIGLCVEHHRGSVGIHTLSRRTWQKMYGTEHLFLNQVSRQLGEL